MTRTTKLNEFYGWSLESAPLGDLSFRLPTVQPPQPAQKRRGLGTPVKRWAILFRPASGTGALRGRKVDVETKVESGSNLINRLVSGHGFQPCRNPFNKELGL